MTANYQLKKAFKKHAPPLKLAKEERNIVEMVS